MNRNYIFPLDATNDRTKRFFVPYGENTTLRFSVNYYYILVSTNASMAVPGSPWERGGNASRCTKKGL